MKNKLVFIDVESDGLYGSFLTVAMIATDIDGNEIERSYYGIRKENMHITEPWVRENVIPRLGLYDPCEDEEELLKKSWEFWLRYQEDAYAVCDVGYPVETRFFEACVRLNKSEYSMKGPFPLLDISSFLYARGYDPLIEREKLLALDESERKHNALYDVEISIEIWKSINRRRFLDV